MPPIPAVTAEDRSTPAPRLRPALRRRLTRALARTAVTVHRRSDTVVTASAIAHLPPPARRYLELRGVVGRPRVWSFQVAFSGRFRLGPDRPWLPCEAWQYNVAHRPARVYVMRLRIAGAVPMHGVDTYVNRLGSMRGRLLGVPVVNASGPEMDVGELATYLDDALLLAPSMLLVPEVTWDALDERSFRVTLRDGELAVSAFVEVDELGRLVEVLTSDRWAALQGGMRRAPWRTPVDGWVGVDGTLFPGRCRAVWDLEDGPYPYAEGTFHPSTFRTNLLPSEAGTLALG